MNPSTALARAIVDQLVEDGVREAVLCPGSRNAPLSFALHAADAEGLVRLHVRIDERTAGFLALGLAKASGLPVPVVTTSGTAAVNLHPAVVEADHSGVRLMVLTADRPVELRGTGANQTIDQVRLYGDSVRCFEELSADGDLAPPDVSGWRETVARAVELSRRGPVHLNVAFREPLVPGTADGGAADSAHDSDDVGSGARAMPLGDGLLPVVLLDAGPRTVVVAGDGAGWEARWVAEAASWPLLAEPSSGARSGPNALAAYRFLLDRLGPEIERVVVYGRPTLSRPVTRLLARGDVEVVVAPRRGRVVALSPTPPVVAELIAPAWVAKGAPRADPDAWLTRWLDADRVARQAMTARIDDEASGVSVARAVAAAFPPGALLVVGSSSSVRDLDLAPPWEEPLLDSDGVAHPDDHRLVLANRGAAGIDGTVSTAVGAALAHQAGRDPDGSDHRPAYALMGDLTFLHDSNGLVLGPDEPRPDLTIVVVNDDGGGLFSLLEQGDPAYAAAFERVFGTPHGVAMSSLCAATGTPYQRAETPDELRAMLERPNGIRVVEIHTDRSRTRALHESLRQAVADSLGSI